jgi:hypothetical protein
MTERIPYYDKYDNGTEAAATQLLCSISGNKGSKKVVHCIVFMVKLLCLQIYDFRGTIKDRFRKTTAPEVPKTYKKP